MVTLPPSTETAFQDDRTAGRQGDSHTRGAVHTLALAGVWLTMALAGIVFTEPAPFDLLMLGLIVGLPVVGLARMTPVLLLLACAWLLIGAFGFLSTLKATNASQSAMHTGITLYLSFACIVIAGFVLHNPARHARLIANGLVTAAVIVSIIAIIGYADVLPGSYELFTLHGRARGAFKDPNVLGAFLTPSIVMALHMGRQASGTSRAWYVVGLGIICLALLLSFSRSAWLTTFAAVCIYLYLCILSAPDMRRRMGLILLTAAGCAVAGFVLLAALQFSSVSSLLAERATMSQTHDIGPEGRFGGQLKALTLIMKSPMGIGSLEFRPRYHHEEPHNVWLAMFMNAGWPGGLLYLLLSIGTAIYGFRYIAQPAPDHEIFIVFYAGYIGTLMGGLVVDTDHWRHFFILLGVLWGCMLARPTLNLGVPPERARFLSQ